MNPETEEKIYFYTEDLQVGYGGKQILNPVRIGIKKGEILTLVGPNGAGKSTILKSVAAQLPPLGGAVYLDGADLLGMKGTERARRMAVMFTEKVHAEWMTCRDVVAAGRYPYTGRFGVLSEEDWKAVDEAMEAVQVSELRERDFQTLSDGQRQRVMLARALCQEPELLLLDEPTSYLDIRYKLEFMSVLQELARRTFYRYSGSSGNNLQNLQDHFPYCDSTLPKGMVCFHPCPDIPESQKELDTYGCTHPDCCNHMFYRNYDILHSHIG